MSVDEKKQKMEQVLVGIQSIAAALKNNPAGIRLLQIATDTGNQRVKDLSMLARDAGIEVNAQPRETLDTMSGFERHQDVIALLHENAPLGEADLLPLLESSDGDALVLVLDEVQDPHNLGACMRSAEAAGVNAIIIPKDRSVGITPVVRKASAGASEIIPLFQVTNLARTLRSLKKAGIWLVATSDQSETSIYEQNLCGPIALVMGNEGQGIRRLTSELCDYHVKIPM
ncbi:MAG: 23S rRNA (guanosine2251-2'-O)-methyltransferase, partial [Lysobacterales bacterium]